MNFMIAYCLFLFTVGFFDVEFLSPVPSAFLTLKTSSLLRYTCRGRVNFLHLLSLLYFYALGVGVSTNHLVFIHMVIRGNK